MYIEDSCKDSNIRYPIQGDKLTDKRKSPAPCTPEIYKRVIASLINGVSLAQQIESQRGNDDFPTRTTIMNYINADNARKSEYIHAREDCADCLAEQVVVESDSSIDPQRASNRMKARQWLASKIKPKVYGDKLDIDLKGSVDIGAAILAGRRRSQLIDVTPHNAITTTDIQSDDTPVIDPFS